MKYSSKLLFFPILTIGLAFSCTAPQKKEAATEEAETASETPEITLTKAPSSPSFPDASLTKAGVEMTLIDTTYKVTYDFTVENYELGAQTSDAPTRGIANSGKGQHIHYIVNNGPYAAHYMPGVNSELEAGNYVVLAFLSRSYHESVKSAGAFYIENLTVGDVEKEEADLTAPHLFYSRPKGTYKGADTKKVMLDFYLLNTTISPYPDGNKVKATINGKEFTVDTWAPYFIEGLPMGASTIKLELIDSEGKLIEGPFNSVERTITLTE